MPKNTVTRRSAVRARVDALGSHVPLLWVAGLLLTIMLVSCGGDSGANGAASVATAKDLAPDFSFTLYQGESKLGAPTLDLSSLQGRPTVLNFWAGLCPPCRAELPDLQDFYDEFNDRVTLISVDLGQFTGLGTQEDAKDLLSELGITYPAGFTDDNNVVRQYKVLSMPTTVFINSQGEIFRKWSGALNRDALTKVTTEMLVQESSPAP